MHYLVAHFLVLDMVWDIYQHVWIVAHYFVADLLGLILIRNIMHKYGSMCTASLHISWVLRCSRITFMQHGTDAYKDIFVYTFNLFILLNLQQALIHRQEKRVIDISLTRYFTLVWDPISTFCTNT